MTPRATKSASATGPADAGQAELQEKFDKAADQGFFGVVPDETPNEHYTLLGVISGKPTPETQRKH
jgi:hypothetical protein